MQVEWIKNLKTEEEREKFREILQSSRFILDRLSEIVYNRIKNRNSSSVEDYDSPSWALRQADITGEQRALNWVLKLIEA